jgi:hypothetical protein
MKRLPLFIGLMLLLLASCEKDIEFNGEVTEPLMVINAIIPQDSLFEIRVTKSRFFMQYEDTFETVKNATVELYVNGVLNDTMAHAGNGLYTSNYKLNEGDWVRIVSQAPNLKTCTAEMQIVQPVTLVKLDTSIVINSEYPIVDYQYDDDLGFLIDTIGWTSSCTINCKLTLSDKPNEENFYRLVIFNKLYNDSVHYNINYNWFERTDVVFGEGNQVGNDMVEVENGSYNMYGTFTDELFDGKNYPLTFSIEATLKRYIDGPPSGGSSLPGWGYSPARPSEIVIDLQTLSKSYYLYMVTSSSYNDGDLFAEPVQIHSNVNGGVGILGNYSHKQIQLNSTF